MSTIQHMTCPHCGTALSVDVDAGVVVHHEPPTDHREKVDLDQRIDRLKEQQQRAADKMEEALRKEKDRSRLMEDRFNELMKGAKDKDDASRPLRDIDLD